jgi:hypothetical protein
LLIFASKDVMDFLARDFAKLATKSDCKVRFLGSESSGLALADETLVPMNTGDPGFEDYPWLHMIVDGQSWLTARFNRDDGPEFPCGWWGDDPAMASIMARPFVLDLEGSPTIREETSIPEPETEKSFAQGPEEAFTEMVAEPEIIEDEDEEDDDQDFDLDFVVKHDDD